MFYLSQGDHSYDAVIAQNREDRRYEDYIEVCLYTGFWDSALLYGVDSLVCIPIMGYNILVPAYSEIDYDAIREDLSNYLAEKTETSIDANLYYAGRCIGDITFIVIDFADLADLGIDIGKYVIKNKDNLIAGAKNLFTAFKKFCG